MLIYNTTYQVDMNDARNFVIWVSECYIPEVEKNGKLKNPRLVRILTHRIRTVNVSRFSGRWKTLLPCIIGIANKVWL